MSAPNQIESVPTAPAAHVVIRVEDVHKYYQLGETRVHALRGVSLDIQRGEFVAIMGASGSGKSTFMNMLGCLDRPSAGRYLLEGIDVSEHDKKALALIRNQRIGFVFQGFNLLSRTTALENTELPTLYTRIDKKEREKRAAEALAMVGLADRAGHFSSQMSGGQQQRVAIARALVNRPSILLADEPTGNLDSRTSVEIMEIFQNLNEKGLTIVLVTHEHDIAQFAKRVLIFRDGKPLVYASGDFPESQRRAMVIADYAGFRARQEAARMQGRYVGIGIANYVEGTGLGPFEGATVRILPSGKVAVATGATTQGQGTRTTLAQIVADQVGCRLEDIALTAGDTAAISQGVGAFASRQAVNAGSSALLAGESVRKQVIALAARVLAVAEDEIELEDGRAVARGGNKPSIGLGELARIAQGIPGVSFEPGQTPGLEHTAYFTPPQASHCNGTHVAEVEVDPITGGVTILKYTVAHDSGNVINPLIVDGQVQGGVAHGIGNALFERMHYDNAAQPLTTTFQDYLLPAASDVPACQIEHVETPNPLNPLGVKGAGEGGTIPAPAAIISAIEDALSPFGVYFTDMPLTPDRIVTALRNAGAYEKLSRPI